MKKILINKINLIFIGVIVLLIVGGYFAYQNIFVKSQTQQVLEEVDLTFDPEGPYALIFPRRDGNALNLNLKRTASYDKINYELSYVSLADNTLASTDGESAPGGIDRGVMGDINTGEKKGEYDQEILFGTCSKNVCKYDKGVENGTLILHIQKGKNAYRMITQWHLQKPDEALGVLNSGDGHFVYKIDPTSTDLSLVQYTIVNDLTGAPKLPKDKVVSGKVYSVNAPVAKLLPKGTATIELAEKPAAGSQIARFDEAKNDWVLYETKENNGKLEALVDGSGVITVLSPKN